MVGLRKLAARRQVRRCGGGEKPSRFAPHCKQACCCLQIFQSHQPTVMAFDGGPIQHRCRYADMRWGVMVQ